jgi:hypothetical protein
MSLSFVPVVNGSIHIGAVAPAFAHHVNKGEFPPCSRDNPGDTYTDEDGTEWTCGYIEMPGLGYYGWYIVV